MKAAAKRKDFRPVPLKATLDLHANANTEVINSHNVLGIVPGSKYPDETVIYTAHWDHLGIGQPDATGDRIYNGAIDNGTGLAQLIEQGRAFAHGPRPQRSVVFMAVTAEEKGLLGSEYYAANPIYPVGQDRGRDQHRRARRARPGARFHRPRQPEIRAARHARRGSGEARPPLHARSASGDRRLLPLRPFHPRQGRGSGAELRPGPGSGERRRAARRSLVEELHRQRCTTSRPTNIRRRGISPAWRRTPSCSTASVCASPIRATGPTGAPDSEFRAARDASASERGTRANLRRRKANAVEALR